MNFVSHLGSQLVTLAGMSCIVISAVAGVILWKCYDYQVPVINFPDLPEIKIKLTPIQGNGRCCSIKSPILHGGFHPPIHKPVLFLFWIDQHIVGHSLALVEFKFQLSSRRPLLAGYFKNSSLALC